MIRDAGAVVTEAEAKAALRALGTRLEWAKSENFEHLWRCTNVRGYSIQPTSSLREKNGLPYAYVCYWTSDVVDDESKSPPYPTLEAAENACDAHYATRQ